MVNDDDEIFTDDNGLDYRLVEKTRELPRHTYIKANLNGKYWGEIYEEEEEDMKIWDTTLGDGLDDETNDTIYWDGTVEGPTTSQKI